MLKIYGASDDLIEIEGDDTDEIGAYGTVKYLHFDTGHILKVWYPEDGVWKIEKVRDGRGECTIELCNDPDADPYSDVAVIADAKRWCATESPSGPTDDDIDLWWNGVVGRNEAEKLVRIAYMESHPWMKPQPPTGEEQP